MSLRRAPALRIRGAAAGLRDLPEFTLRVPMWNIFPTVLETGLTFDHQYTNMLKSLASNWPRATNDTACAVGRPARSWISISALAELHLVFMRTIDNTRRSAGSGDPRRARNNSLSGNRVWQQRPNLRASLDTIQRIFVTPGSRNERENANGLRMEGDTIRNCVTKKLGPLCRAHFGDKIQIQTANRVRWKIGRAEARARCDKIRPQRV